jgi:hypothetical protein
LTASQDHPFDVDYDASGVGAALALIIEDLDN